MQYEMPDDVKSSLKGISISGLAPPKRTERIAQILTFEMKRINPDAGISCEEITEEGGKLTHLITGYAEKESGLVEIARCSIAPISGKPWLFTGVSIKCYTNGIYQEIVKKAAELIPYSIQEHRP